MTAPSEKNFELVGEDRSAAEIDESELIKRFHPRLLYFAVRRLRDKSLAEDLAQEVLTAVIAALRAGRIREPEKLPAFVFAIARNHVLMSLKESQRAGDAHFSLNQLEPQDRSTRPDAALLREEQKKLVNEALLQLSAEDRDLLRQVLSSDQPLEEIAARLGIPYTAARKRKSRALERLRKVVLERHKVDGSGT